MTLRIVGGVDGMSRIETRADLFWNPFVPFRPVGKVCGMTLIILSTVPSSHGIPQE